MNNQLLGIYLNDHLLGATAGVELFKRASAHLPELKPLTREVEQDRDALLRIMRTLGVPVREYKIAIGWATEKLGRFKPNGYLTGRSPLSDLVELESLVLGVTGKLAAWRLLRALEDARLDAAELDELIGRAERQAERLEQLRLQLGPKILKG